MQSEYHKEELQSENLTAFQTLNISKISALILFQNTAFLCYNQNMQQPVFVFGRPTSETASSEGIRQPAKYVFAGNHNMIQQQEDVR